MLFNSLEIITPRLKKADDATVECYSDLLINFIEDNKLKNIILIGHSMGGGTISLGLSEKTWII